MQFHVKTCKRNCNYAIPESVQHTFQRTHPDLPVILSNMFCFNMISGKLVMQFILIINRALFQLHPASVFYSFYVTHHITPFVIACLLYYMVFITTSCDFISFNVVLSFWSYNKYLFWLFSYIQSSSIMTGIKQILTKKEKNTDEHSRTV